MERLIGLATNHKKKVIFFTAISAFMQYKNFYGWLTTKIKSMEKLSSKLKRWVLGEKNLELQSLRENKFRELKQGGIMQETHSQLSQIFFKTDNELFFGITFSYLLEVL